MGLFGFGKKVEEETKGGCCCGGTPDKEPANECCCGGIPDKGPANECCCGTDSAEETACGCNIKVLGAGCKSCHEQHENVKKAVADMKLDAEVEYITDMEKVMGYGVMSMPAIVVNEKVVSMGKVLKAAQVEELLKKLGC